MNKPLIIFVFTYQKSDTSTRYGGFAKKLQKAGGLLEYDVLTVALENLIFSTNETGSVAVIDAVSNIDMRQADFVYLKSWEAMPEEASALCNYLHHLGISFIDTLALGMGVSKLATTFRLCGRGVALPATVYVRSQDKLQEFLCSKKAEALGDKFVLKDILGAKGKMNFLVTHEEALNVVEQYPDIQFMCQRFVTNDGDYRVGVYGGKSGFIIKRVASSGTHLSNTSAGGKAEYISTHLAPKKLLQIAEAASAASYLQVAGVDIIRDKITDDWLVLEVNQGSQIVTGANVEENIEVFNEQFKSMVKSNQPLPSSKPPKVIGRRAIVRLPDLGVVAVTAKIDTGAYNSTIHAENIHLESVETGDPVLVFDLAETPKLSLQSTSVSTIRTSDYFIQTVRSSNGGIESRYSIKTVIVIEKKKFSVILTLSDRSQMGYPLLIGRKALRSRFIVNVEIDEQHKTKWDY